MVAEHAPGFLFAGNRFRDLVAPEVSRAIQKMETGDDMLHIKLVRAQAHLLNTVIKGLELQ